MVNRPFVSVIIPNYNHARYLDQRIQTVLNQTYQNFELIILDDCSTDNSLEVIAKYRDNCHISHIVVNEKNSGSTFKQWDKGINLAKGDVIWIAESDDYCELNMLEELVNAMTKHSDVVVAKCQLVYFDEESQLKGKEHKTRYYNGASYVQYRMSRLCYLNNASGIIFSRKAAIKISKDYLTYKSAGDYHFWCEILQYGSVVNVGKNLSYFRQLNYSVTGTNSSKGITATEDKRVYDYIDKTYHLTDWQRKMAHWYKIPFYQKKDFNSSSIRQNILSIWGIGATEKIPFFAKFLFWLSGSLERHFGILV